MLPQTSAVHLRVRRRDFLFSFAAAALESRFLANSLPGSRRHPLQVGKPIPVEDSHGDTWMPVWADDGYLYSPSDDSYGFRKATDSNIAFNRLWSGLLQLHGRTVNAMTDYGHSTVQGTDGCTWKSSGCTYIDGALYLVVARHNYGETSGDSKMRQTASRASIIRSMDFGRTWQRTAEANMNSPMFPGSHFATPYFVQYAGITRPSPHQGPYVYALSNNGYWDNGDYLIVGRVRRDRIQRLQAADWEYLADENASRPQAWARNPAEARPILHNPGKLGMTGAIFIPRLGSYLMIGWYYPAGGAKLRGAAGRTVWDFYTAREPWGPWSQIGSQTFTPQGYYSPQICPKLLSAKRAVIWTAGNWNEPKYYKLTVLPLAFD